MARRPPSDEILQFSHEDIDGPEDQEEYALGDVLLSEGSDGAENALPPYPDQNVIAGSNGNRGVSKPSPNGAVNSENRRYPAAPYGGGGGPANPPPAQTSPHQDMPGPGPPRLQENGGVIRRMSYCPPPVSSRMQSPPPLAPSHIASNGVDVKPFQRGPDGWNSGPPGPYPNPEGGMVHSPAAPHHRPVNLDLQHRPPMARGQPYPHYMTRPPHGPGDYAMCRPPGDRPVPPMAMRHHMVFPPRPGMHMMMPERMAMMMHGPNGPMPDQVYRKPPHIKKPLNAFMLFMKEQRAQVVAECTLKESAAINQILGKKWHGLTRVEQAKYYDMAREERQQHQRMYPNYNPREAYCGMGPRRGRRQRRGDRLENDEVTQLKKCRARYGLEHQEKWCKPCRRKKKCIKFTSADDNASDEEDGDAKRERESRDRTAADGGNSSDKEDSSDLDEDDKSIASANSSGESGDEDDDDLMPHFNDEEVDMLHLMPPALQKPGGGGGGGGIAVLANRDADFGGAAAAAAATGGSLFAADPHGVLKFPSLPSGVPVRLGGVGGGGGGDHGGLDVMSGSGMILSPTTADASKEQRQGGGGGGGGDLCPPLTSMLPPKPSGAGGADATGSLTPMRTPEDPAAKSPGGGKESSAAAMTGATLTTLQQCSSEAEKPAKLSAPTAVLSMAGF